MSCGILHHCGLVLELHILRSHAVVFAPRHLCTHELSHVTRARVDDLRDRPGMSSVEDVSHVRKDFITDILATSTQSATVSNL